MRKIQEINIVLYVVLCVLSLGLFYFVWQYKQMHQCNLLLGRDDHSLFKWFFLSLITFGVYHFYHEYKMSIDIIELQNKFKMDKIQSSDFPLLCLLISIFGLFLLSDFIHQIELNKLIAKVNQEPELLIPAL